MLKILLLLTIFVCCLLIGLGINNYYKKRKNFYCDLSNFCENCKVHISYANTKLGQIVEKMINEMGRDFGELLENFEKYTKNQIEKEEFFYRNKLNFLNPSERKDVLDFFLKLGEFDKNEELEKIESSKINFDERKTKTSSDYKKFSSFYLKLFVIIGLAIVIIFI